MAKAKAKTRRALGRGLSSLIPLEDERPSGGSEEVDVNAIRPNPFQPRVDFREEEIRELVQSIESQGLLQPIIVRRKTRGYEVISGERRLRALKELGWDRIPCIVKQKVSDREMLEMALVENLQREDLNDIELGSAYQRLLLECRLTHEQLSERLGKNRSTITNTLRLQKLPAAVREMIRKGELSSGHARALLGLEDTHRIEAMARTIVARGLSVREAEEMVRRGNSGHRTQRKREKAGKSSATADPHLNECEDRLRQKLGTSVRIARSSRGGKIVIAYRGVEEMNRILELLLEA
jgi:ParB family chromosome partitioning protein